MYEMRLQSLEMDIMMLKDIVDHGRYLDDTIMSNKEYLVTLLTTLEKSKTLFEKLKEVLINAQI